MKQNGKLLMFILNVFIYQDTNKVRFSKNEEFNLLFIVF